MTRNRTQLATRALEVLHVLGAGQAPSTEDINAVDRMIDPVLQMLMRLDLVYIGDADEIDEAYFEPVASVLAEHAAPDFGVDVVGPYGIADRAQRARADLREMTRGRPAYTLMRPEYF